MPSAKGLPATEMPGFKQAWISAFVSASVNATDVAFTDNDQSINLLGNALSHEGTRLLS